MKKYLLYISIFAFVLLGACVDSNENLVQERGVAVGLASFEAIPAFFTEDLDNSYVAFDLAALPEGVTIDKAEIEIVFGRESVILREVTLPTEGVVVTANEVLAALGISAADISQGDVFYLYVLTTKDGKTTRSSAAMSIPVTCEFDVALTAGIYNFESSDWGVSGKVTLEADPEDPYKLIILGYPEAEGLVNNITGNRIELNINPNTFDLNGPKVMIARDITELGDPYTDYSYEPIAGAYNSCDGSYTVTFAITVAQGSFGNNVFTFTRELTDEED